MANNNNNNNGNDPHIFVSPHNPVGLRCGYVQSARNIINGRPNTFGMVMHWEIAPMRRAFALYASDQMVAWEQNVITTITNKYSFVSFSNIIGINIMSGMDLLKHIFGGRRYVPRIYSRLYGNQLFAIPVINNYPTSQLNSRRIFRPIEIFSIWGLALDRRRHLHALFQLAIMNWSGLMVSNGNDPLYWTWDSISVKLFDQNGRLQGRYCLPEAWQHKMVQFITNNHMFPLNF